ncbi:MAG TPA: hypothetical protein VMY34_09030, partial [Acidimicrobiales bacterium]|nr:hypothetical protein [Acidimicrobiales bacterium]
MTRVVSGVRRVVAGPGDLPTPQPTTREVHDQIEEILHRPEFRPPPQNPIERARDWVFEKVDELLDNAFGSEAGSIVSIVVLGLATVVLVYFIVKLVRSVRRDARHRASDHVEVGRPVEAWLADAAGHEARADWRPALRCRYRALVADLAGRGLVDEIPGRTSGEYRREVTSNLPDGAPSFAGAT